ncbi:MAG: type II toxin-antitoxin system RelE/ParE family toxin [Candidatus Pacebacteria bacterium]|nr:type II toxin-antitoxin system RelE/ParE family toxin [Candidatus Paceibacterota bacterium]
MVDKIAKALRKLSPSEREKLKNILLLVRKGEIKGLDIKKLKGRDDIYRARKGDLRIIFRNNRGAIKILALEHRTSSTYRK